ncbi:MAG: YjbQ family protein [Cytophagales bacterium]|nr:YjbQ family protein [Cytophagales bacterium]
MLYFQKELTLRPYKRGFHLITAEVLAALPELAQLKVGLLHLHLAHTSASLTLNENADPTVRQDFESHFNQMVPENATHYRHTLEGPDDMPAHLKASLLGFSLTIPVTMADLTWESGRAFTFANTATTAGRAAW